MSDIGTRLVEERARLGLTQDEMAAAAGVAKSTYCNYEAGKRVPDGTLLARIAAIRADVLYILTGSRSGGPVAQPESRREMALLDNFRHAPPDAQDGVLKLLAASAKPHTRRRVG